MAGSTNDKQGRNGDGATRTARLTTRQGHPVYDNQNQRTVGSRGPATLENYHFLEKIAHFDRERIPERVVHARGFVAHGVFEAYGKIGDEPASTYTRAKLFQTDGQATPVVIRFSTVIGGRDSSEVARDPRGFAVKFKTEDGNWDLVGNNLPVFFIRDAIKFPDVIHSLKPDPVTFRQEPNRIFDFMSLTPESMHMLTWLFSPRGIPKDYRHMDGFGVNTYRMVNATGEAVLVKYHWKTQQGVESLTQAQADAIQATELGSASKDLFEAIERGDFPRWELNVQIMPRRRAPGARLRSARRHEDLAGGRLPAPAGRDDDPEPERRELLRRERAVGLRHRRARRRSRVLRRQDAGRSDLLVLGHAALSGRAELPAAADQRPARQAGDQPARRPDGVLVDATGPNPHINFEPNSTGGLQEADPAGPAYEPMIQGRLTRSKIERTNDFAQAGERYRTMPEWERDDLVANLVGLVGQCERQIQERIVGLFAQCDPDYGARVAEGIGLKSPVGTAAR